MKCSVVVFFPFGFTCEAKTFHPKLSS
uniref:Uncharacterized protein n=1 Tax=Anguilla anguilla TaxID=7936 RepID=A0A0E9TQH7_ANGAN